MALPKKPTTPAKALQPQPVVHSEKKDMKEYNDYIKELYKVIDKIEAKEAVEKSFEKDMHQSSLHGEKGSTGHEESYINTTQHHSFEDEDEKDQNEEELEKLRPQIELDITQTQDRDDDPSFDNDSEIILPLPEEAWLKENREKSKDDEDEILKLLKDEESLPIEESEVKIEGIEDNYPEEDE